MPMEDYDEWWIGHKTSCEVIEEDDDEETIQSSLVSPNGQPIIYHRPSSKQGFIGFIDPDTYPKLRSAARGKRYKARRKS